jgi:thioglycine synthase
MMLQRCPKVSPETGIRTITPEETLKRAIPLLEKAGMHPLEDITALDNIGIPVFSVYRDKTAKGTFGEYNGKGPTPEQAMASAAMEALERYSAEIRDTDEIVYGTVDQAMENGLTVDPVELILPLRTLDYIQDAEVAWTPAYEMFRGRDVWVPACEAYYPYYPKGDLQLYRFHTNGIAAGNTIEEAILHGTLELIERDAWSLAEDRNAAAADVIIDNKDSIAAKLIERFNEQGVEIHLKDLTTDIGITTIGAASDDTATEDPEMLSIGVGTHLNPEIAAIRAITEVAQSRTTHKHGVKANARLQKIAQDMGYEKIKEVNRLWYSDSPKKVDLSDIPDVSTEYVLDDIEVVFNRLVECGFDMVICKDLTRPELGVPVVRMIVPGLEVTTMDPEREGYRIRGCWPPVRD